MVKARICFLSVVVVLLLAFLNLPAWAGGKIAVVQYELKPVKTVDSGRFIKTEWNAKIRNRASESVKFSVTILFVDSNNDTLKETTSQCELSAKETKNFKDTVLVEAAIATKIASTRVTVKEITEEEVSP